MLTGVDVVLGGGALLATASTLARPGRAAPERHGPAHPARRSPSWPASRRYVARARLARRARPRCARARRCCASPRRFLREAVSWQVGAWLARVGVAFIALHAFGLPASLLDAVLVVVVTGLAGVIPFLPGGVGAQQAMLVYALRKTASAASVVTFGVGMQLGVTLHRPGRRHARAADHVPHARPARRPARQPAPPSRARRRSSASSARSSLIRPVTPSAVARSASWRWLTGHVMSSGACVAQRVQALALEQPQVQRGAVERRASRVRDQPRRAAPGARPSRCGSASAGSISSSSGHARAET